jgi:hypothetical protein
MSVSEEMLMAYADGEYDAPERLAERSAIEAAVRSDPELAKRVEQHQALRRRVGALYAEVLDEPVPERLIAAVRGTRGAQPQAGIVDLGRARTARQRGAADAVRRVGRVIPRWAALAASLMVGLVAGYLAWSPRESGLIMAAGGQLTARSSLERALTSRIAGQQATVDSVHVGLSFKSKSGAYCRTFALQQTESLSGLACRHGDRWRIEALARTSVAPGLSAAYRPAGSELPDAVRVVVEAQMAGEPLDAQGEALAQQHDWQ